MKARCELRAPSGRKKRAQSMVEFALVLPILLLIMFSLIEAGRLLFFYSSVFTASREGARYGSAGGLLDDGSAFRYQDCDGIRAAARRVGFFANVTNAQVEIRYDNGPGDTRTWSSLPVCNGTNTVTLGARVAVRVTTTYSTLVPMLGIAPFNVQSMTARTILKDIELGSGYTPIAGGGGPTRTPTPSPTATTVGAVTATPTATSIFVPVTPTPTPTSVPPTVTPTPSFICNQVVRISGPTVSGSSYSFSIQNQNPVNATISSMTIDWTWNGNPKLVSVTSNSSNLVTYSPGVNGPRTINPNLTFNANATRSFVLAYNASLSATPDITVTFNFNTGCSATFKRP